MDRQAYKQLKDSAVGKHLLAWLQSEYDSLLEKATQSASPDEGYAYLKKASGILEVIRYIDSMASATKASRER